MSYLINCMLSHIKSRKKVFFWVLYVFTFLFSSNAFSSAKLLGVAEHQPFGRTEYIAAIYIDDYIDIQSVPDIVRSVSSIEFKITGERISKRRFFQNLIQQLAINTGESEMREGLPHLESVKAIFQGGLIQHDHLKLSLVGSEVYVSLNNVLIKRIDSPSFISFLVSAWIGEVPPSSEFKHDLINGVLDEELVSILSESSYSMLRYKEILLWVAEHGTEQFQVPGEELDQEDSPVVSQEGDVQQPNAGEPPWMALYEDESVKSDNVESDNEIRNIEKNSASEKTNKLEKRGLSHVSEPSEAKAPIKPAKKIVLAKPVTTQPKKVVLEKATPEKVESKTSQLVASSKKNSPQSESVVKETSSENENLEQVKGEYTKLATKNINKYKRMPRGAIQKRQSGEVSVELEVSAQGEVLEVAISKPSKFQALNQQAIEAVKKASPLPPIPSELNEPSLAFQVVLKYPKYF